jgi:hypothetical protein
MTSWNAPMDCAGSMPVRRALIRRVGGVDGGECQRPQRDLLAGQIAQLGDRGRGRGCGGLQGPGLGQGGGRHVGAEGVRAHEDGGQSLTLQVQEDGQGQQMHLPLGGGIVVPGHEYSPIVGHDLNEGVDVLDAGACHHGGGGQHIPGTAQQDEKEGGHRQPAQQKAAITARGSRLHLGRGGRRGRRLGRELWLRRGQILGQGVQRHGAVGMREFTGEDHRFRGDQPMDLAEQARGRPAVSSASPQAAHWVASSGFS